MGIGTEEPLSPLHVTGDVQIDSRLKLSGDLLLPSIIKDTSYPNTDSSYLVLQLKSDGTIVAKKIKIGILPTDPNEPFGPFGPCGKYTDVSGAVSVPNPQWYTGLNKIFTGCSAINVGIGEINPRVNLDVIGTTYSKKIFLGLADPTLGTSTSAYFRLKANNAGSNADSTIFIVENSTRKLFQIQNDGLVRAREIKVDLATNWPDYVFRPEYNLMPLNKVKSFIAENGHLPNIPKAETVESEGLALGEMNRLLMGKVEELTLYVIDMKEEQERLNLEIEELKTEKLER